MFVNNSPQDLKREGYMKNNAETENKCDLKDYDELCVDTKYVDGEKVEYKIIFGNDNIVFIKAGAGGNVQGYKNKYLQMAKRIHKRIGATVICASNPDVPHVNIDEQEIRWVIAKKGLSNFKVFFIGTSDGAYHNLSLAKRFSESAKWLGINTSYINVPKFEERLLALPNVYKILVYGTNDDDFNEIVPAISEITSENLVLKLVDGADHNFNGRVEEFIALIDYLYN